MHGAREVNVPVAPGGEGKPAMLLTILAASVIAAPLGRPHHHVVCEGHHACIEHEARWECRHWHSARHCRIWHRWQHKLWLAKHPPASAPPAPAAAVSSSTSAASSFSSSDLADVPGVPYSFAACVAFRESTDGQLSSNIYGIQGPGGWGTLAQQKEAFSQMYAARGTEPWAPYDGC